MAERLSKRSSRQSIGAHAFARGSMIRSFLRTGLLFALLCAFATPSALAAEAKPDACIVDLAGVNVEEHYLDVKWTPAGPLVASMDGLRRGDANATFVNKDIGRVFAIIVSRDGQRVAALGLGKLLRSEDGGRTFATVELPESRAFETGAFVRSDLLVFSAAGNGYRVSSNGTVTPFNVPKKVTWWGASFADENRGYLIGACNSALVTDDGGVTWSEFPISLEDPQGILALGDRVWIAADGGLHLSEDRGKSFSRVVPALGCYRLGGGKHGVAVGCRHGSLYEPGAVSDSLDGRHFKALDVKGAFQGFSADIFSDGTVIAVERRGTIYSGRGDALSLVHESNEARETREAMLKEEAARIAAGRVEDLQGIAVDEEGRPLGNVDLRERRPTDLRPSETQTDAEGAFTLRQLKRGQVDLEVFPKLTPLGRLVATGVDVPANGRITVTFKSPPPPSTDVVVTNHGHPVPFAVVAWKHLARSGAPDYMRADADGRAVVPLTYGRIWANDAGVPQDEGSEKLWRLNHDHQWTLVRVDPATVQPVTIELQQGLSANITIVDDLGEPLRNQRIRIDGVELDYRSLRTSEAGILKIDHLFEQHFILDLQDGAMSSWDDRASIRPPNIPPVVVLPRRVTVRGMVQLDGNPIAKFKINGREFESTDGRFEVRASPRQLLILSGDFEDVRLKLNAQPGQVVDLGIISVKRKAAKEAPREGQ